MSFGVSAVGSDNYSDDHFEDDDSDMDENGNLKGFVVDDEEDEDEE